MKTKKVQPSFFQKNKEVIIVGGVILLLTGAGLTYYLVKKKKQTAAKKKTLAQNTIVTSTSYQTPDFVPASSNKPLFRGYPIKYGSRSEGVKILQRYLKIYKLPLGKTGPNRDGVDGIFGPKTASAAQKQLGKTVFQKADIDAMKKTLQTLKT